MGKVVGLAFVSAANPALVAAKTIILMLPRPQRLMLGYWFGAMLTGVTLGVVIVVTLEGSGFEESSKKRSTRRSRSRWRVSCCSPSRCSPPAATSRLRSDAGRARSRRNHRAGFVALDKLGKLHYSTFATVWS